MFFAGIRNDNFRSQSKELLLYLLMIVFFLYADICRDGEGIASTSDEPNARADQSAATRTEKPSPSASTDSPTVKLIDMVAWSPHVRT